MSEGNLDQKWTKSVSINANATSDPVVIPGNIDKITCLVVPGGGGTAKLQYTTMDPATVVAAPGSATWVDWSEGSVNAATAKALVGSVSCVRFVSVTAGAALHIAGQRLR